MLNKTLKFQLWVRLISFSVIFTALISSGGIALVLVLGERTENLRNLDLVQKYLNSIDPDILNSNFYNILKRLQRILEVQEVGIFDQNCNLIETSSLKINTESCLGHEYQRSTVGINGKKIILLFHKVSLGEEIVSKHLYLLIYICVFIFILSLSLLGFFFYRIVMTPIETLKQRVSGVEITGMLPAELVYVEEKLSELNESLLRKEKEAMYVKMSQRIVHDIRTPLYGLRQILKHSSVYPSVKNRIEEIEFQINSLLAIKKPSKEIFVIELKRFFEGFVDEARYIYNLDLELDISNQMVLVTIHPRELKSIIFNLIKNSSEAKSHKIVIRADVVSAKLRIIVIDDGLGIDENIIKKINMAVAVTTKIGGSGIGLSGSKDILNGVGGSIYASNNGGAYTGACITVDLPLWREVNLCSLGLVLIDDDKFIRQNWIQKCKATGFIVYAYGCIDDFLRDDKSLPKTTPILIDSYLDNGARGEIESKKIFEHGYKNLIIFSAADDLDLSESDWIQGSINKSDYYME